MKQDTDNDDNQSLPEGGYDLLNQGVSIYDADGRLVVCNQIFLDLFDIPEELTRPGTQITDILRHFAERGDFGPGDIDDLVRGRLSIVTNKDIDSFRRVLPNGRVIQFSQSFLPDGGFVTVYADISEHKRAEERLRQQAIVIDQMEEAVIITGLDRRVIDVNAAGERLTGFTRQEILGQVPDELFSLNIPLQGIIDEADEKGSWRGELELERKDGTVRHVETVIVVLRDEQHMPVARVGVSRDITERKKSEDALRQSEAKFRNLIEGSIQGALIHESLKIVYANQAVGKILGRDPADLIGMSVIDLVAPEDRELVHGLQKMGQTGATEVRVVGRDGTIIWTESISKTIEWDGRPARQVTMVDISKRKRAEEDLRRQAVVMEQIEEAVIITDRNRRIVYMNPGVERLFGFSRDEIFGKVPDETFSTTLPIEDVLETIGREGIWRGEIDYVRKDGATGNAETVIQPLRDELGAAIGMVGVSRDITVRKKAEQALRDSETKFRNLIDDSVQGVFIHQDGKVVYANRAMADLYRCSIDDLIGSDPDDLVATEDRQRIRTIRAREQSTKYLEFKGLRRDQSVLWLNASAAVIDWDNRPARQISCVDITEHKKAEEANRRQAVVLAQLEEAVFITGLDRRIIDCNPAAEKIIGCPRSELIGKTTSFLVADPDEWNRGVGDVYRQLDEDGRWFGEVELRRSDGSIVIGELMLAPLEDDAGDRIAVSAVLRDITDRRKAEQALLKAREVAERANDAKTRFLAAASHDLRQPVQALRLLTEALAKVTDSKTFAEIVSEIQTCTEAMDGLLNAVLDISKLEAGVVKTEPEVFPIGQVLTSLVDEFSPLAGNKGLELCSVLSTAFVRTDPVLLQRILRNFISNAIQCTKVGRVLVGCRRSGGTLRLEVWDTGIGIPGSETERIFEEFHQLGNPERSTEKGLGLGLAIAKGTGELLNLPITVRSTVGKGSVFSVTVPLVAGEIAKSEDEDAPAGRPVAANDAFVLLVENEPIVARAAERILKLWGYRVLAFQNVNDAIDAAEKFETSPDAIIADYSLSPEVTGGELIKLLEQRFRSNIAGIILTGDTSPERLREAEAHGYHLLHKPASPRQLRAVLEAALADI